MVVDTGYLIFDDLEPVRSDRQSIIDGLPPGAAQALAIDAALRLIKPIPDVQDSAPRVDTAAAHIADVSRKAFAGQLQDSAFDSNGGR